MNKCKRGHSIARHLSFQRRRRSVWLDHDLPRRAWTAFTRTAPRELDHDVAISATDASPVIPRRYFSGQLNRSNRIGEIMPLTRLSCEGVKASRHSS